MARGAGRQQCLQPDPVEPTLNARAQALDGRNHAVHSLAVARVGHAFAAAADDPAIVPKLGVPGMRELDHNRFGRGPGAARNGEAAGQRPGLVANAQPRHGNTKER